MTVFAARHFTTRVLSKKKLKRRAWLEQNKKPKLVVTSYRSLMWFYIYLYLNSKSITFLNSYGGIAADGSLIPFPNWKRLQYRMYKVLLVQPDGSTYHIRHPFPYKIMKMPLDLSMMTEEQKGLLEKRKEEEDAEKAAALKASYELEEDLDEDEWDQSKYRELIANDKKS